MQRSWVVTIALSLAAIAAGFQGTRAFAQATTATTKAASASTAAKQAASKATTKADHVAHVTMPAQMTWGEAPPALPRGAKAAILYGDPGAASGAFTVRLQMPDGYKVMPHTHPTAEFVTVLSGTLRVGMSRQWDDASMKDLPGGGFAHMPPETAHYVQAKGETTIQVSGQAPFAITYIDPKDDPRKSKPVTSASR